VVSTSPKVWALIEGEENEQLEALGKFPAQKLSTLQKNKLVVAIKKGGNIDVVPHRRPVGGRSASSTEPARCYAPI
jgi:hypothetical protein